MKHTRSIVVCAMLALAAASCSRKPAEGVAPASQPAPAATAPAPAAAGPQTVTGAVVETMDASNYTYVRVKTPSGEIWAASSQFKVVVGDRVVVPLEMPMENFHSATLNRDFPLIYFAPWISREGETGAPPLAAAHAPVAGGATAAAPPRVTEPIAPPADGMTVADVWAKRAALSGKAVTVRGKVVKFNAMILGRNWLHIQDGSGSAGDGTNDLTVTTAAEAKVGDVITVTGTVAIDRDFGAGYAYKVIVEGATVVVK